MVPDPASGSVSSKLRSSEDAALVERLLAGDERTFSELVATNHGGMMRVARTRLRTDALAEEAVQEAWAVFLESLPRFEGRSSVRTWLFGILLNVVRARGRKEARHVFLSANDVEPDVLGGDGEPSVPASRFLSSEHRWAGHWSEPPTAWPTDPALRAEMRGALERGIDALPHAQREAVILRDVLGWSTEEACNALGIADTHLRVILHRARSRLRAFLESYFEEQRAEERTSP